MSDKSTKNIACMYANSNGVHMAASCKPQARKPKVEGVKLEAQCQKSKA
jgi:hypothetical protein